MPVVFRYKGYRFFFFSNEGDPPEPIHIHVRRGEATAKFWMSPQISLAESYNMNSSELRELMRVAEKNKKLIVKGIGMNTLAFNPRAKKVTFDSDNMWVALTDGRQLGVPIAYFPRLLNVTEAQRDDYIISGGGSGLHWEELDEDISVKAFYWELVIGLDLTERRHDCFQPLPC